MTELEKLILKHNLVFLFTNSDQLHNIAELKAGNGSGCGKEEHGKNIVIMSHDTFIGGGWMVHVLIGMYTFAAIAAICDIYFVPSLEHICEG